MERPDSTISCPLREGCDGTSAAGGAETPGTRLLVLDSWYSTPGSRLLVLDSPGSRLLVLDSWYSTPGTRLLVLDSWF
ncbi:hypothetical protein KUCAC02_019390 [Chaenocephalus aceratus]|uniref:Uncharacterized protein n=1 Tax=Chaenocephalus aceratus TaxID=36190 RepID=A0ACB9VNX7_CHAAC|nr:hypothetical protein KUCAC02_019390 [Chaenocephalus aceratus]